MFRLIELLSRLFAGLQTYVSGNLLIYYVEGNPRKSVAPDVFVVKGVAPHPRDIYKLWEERIAPHVVIEVTSKTTRREDLNKKMKLSAQLGIREYFLFDPRGDYLEPALRGYRLVDTNGGAYDMPLELDGRQSLLSEELHVILQLEGQDLALFDARTGERLKTAYEEADIERRARQRAEDALRQEQLKLRALEAELAKLRQHPQ